MYFRKLRQCTRIQNTNLLIVLLFATNLLILFTKLKISNIFEEEQAINGFEVSEISENISENHSVLSYEETDILSNTAIITKNRLSVRLLKRHMKPGINTVLHDSYYEALIKKEDALKVNGLCEDGIGIIISGDDVLKAEMSRNGGFNERLSDMVSYSRKIPDYRHPACINVTYSDDLPRASVIIVFHNEGWSALIRTVHSVLNRSPSHLLKEILLIDDFGDNMYLKGKLNYYIRTRFPSKVRLLRLPVRAGLIRAKLAGAREAAGDVLVFLDAHCEVGYAWLEPLLQRIRDNRKAVVIPLIDPINGTSLGYSDFHTGGQFAVGGFTWDGYFMFLPLSKQETQRRETPISPVRSPTMIGGLFAIERGYFWESGSYDDQMDIWGGENLEMSFRIWQCGGSLEILPCSRIGHIYRRIRPYTFPRIKDTHGYNTGRMAEVWMDEYKEILYLYRRDLKGRNFGDLSERKELRRRLNCKSFKWYLSNIFPDMRVPTANSIAYGQVMNNNLCLDNLQQTMIQYKLGIYRCHIDASLSQLFELTESGELLNSDKCAEIQDATSNRVSVVMYPCHGQKGNQVWNLTKEGELVNIQTGLCLDASEDGNNVKATKCNGGPFQKWKFSEYSNRSLFSPRSSSNSIPLHVAT